MMMMMMMMILLADDATGRRAGAERIPQGPEAVLLLRGAPWQRTVLQLLYKLHSFC